MIKIHILLSCSQVFLEEAWVVEKSFEIVVTLSFSVEQRSVTVIMSYILFVCHKISFINTNGCIFVLYCH